MITPKLPKEDWDQELTSPPSPLDWEQAVSWAAATEGDEDPTSNHQAEVENEGVIAWTVPHADNSDDPVEPLHEKPNIAEGTAVAKASGSMFTIETQTGGSQIGTLADKENVMVKEREEPEVPDDEAVGMTDAAWGPEGTTLKVVDEDPGATQVPVTALMPGQGETLDLEDMPDLEDADSEEIIGEEPPVDVPPTEGPPTIPWVCFEAQICQDELQYWAAMFTWFQYMHLSWEESWRKRDDT